MRRYQIALRPGQFLSAVLSARGGVSCVLIRDRPLQTFLSSAEPAILFDMQPMVCCAMPCLVGERW
jgi:hypothetical protein